MFANRGTAIAAVFVTAALLSGATVARAEALLERGAYLVNTVAGCGRCHTPRDAAHKPIAEMDLAGGFDFDDGVIGHVVGPNLTPDRETGIGNWTEEQIIAALRGGKRPDGTIIGPPMPIFFYRQFSDRDVAAIAAHLRSIKPIRHAVVRTQYKMPLPSSYGPPVTHVEEPSRDDPVAYGAYLAGPPGHCVGCHTPFGKNGQLLDMSRAYTGGRELPDYCHPGAVTISRNITADPDDGLGKWSDDEIKRAITDGVRPDGTGLTCTMPFDWYAKMTPDDLDAMVAFVRTIKALKTQ
jgi:mono/diheme cytochrome c family protein